MITALVITAIALWLFTRPPIRRLLGFLVGYQYGKSKKNQVRARGAMHSRRRPPAMTSMAHGYLLGSGSLRTGRRR